MEVTIDGKKLTLDASVTVLEAASRVGVHIPTLCWHPRVSVLGACRLCMISVEGIPRLLAACTTQVTDGMAVVTDTPKLRKVRQTVLELLLCRHPLDCPTCVKGGECELQELAYRHAAPENRFPENPAPYPVSDPSPFVERDPEKCVLCRRCVRVCREVRGRTVLAAMERGYHKRVGTFFQQDLKSDFHEPYNCEFCGSCINICPVGALNSKVRKFRARTWEGAETSSVCPFCSMGCLLTLQVKEGELVRTMPREGPNNEDQACFRGRFGTDYVNSISRVITPLLRREGKQVPAEREEAVRFLSEKISSGVRTEAMISSSLTQEEVRAARDFMNSLDPGAAVRIVDTLGLEEEKGYRDFGTLSWDQLDEADLVFVAGQDFSVFEPVARVRVRLARKKSGAGLVVLDARDSLLGGEADLWLRPEGPGLPLLLGGLIHALNRSHGTRLKKQPAAALLESLPGGDPSTVEAHLGLATGAVASLAALVAEKEKVVFVSHRGWHDPSGLVPRLLKELNGLLAGDAATGIVYQGRDCNSRGASAFAGGEGKGKPDLLLLFGVDLAGGAPPFSELRQRMSDAATVVTFDSFLNETVMAADAVFPLPHAAEKEGTFIASNGLAQKVNRAMEPPAGVPPLWDHLDLLAESLGKSLSFAPSLGAGAADEGEGTPGDAGLPAATANLPASGEKHLLLRGIFTADHRLRLVPETVRMMPATAVEINPADLGAHGLSGGERVRLLSGESALEVEVRTDLKVPRGQIHFPFDPADATVRDFVEKADRPKEWPAVCIRLSSMEKGSPGGGS